jgi:hypothetical protein
MTSQPTQTIIESCSWDQGSSGPKISLDSTSGTGNITCVLPYYLSYPNDIGLAANGVKLNRVPRISLFGQTFCFGEHALHWGEPIDSLDYQSMFSIPKTALFCASVAQCLPPADYKLKILTVGLPIQLLKDPEEMKLVIDRAKLFKEPVRFEVDGNQYSLVAEKIKLMGQPAGALLNYALDDRFHLKGKARNNGLTAVIDIGRNSIDFYAMSNFEAVPRYVAGEKGGVRRLLNKLQSDRDTSDLEIQLRAGRLQIPKTAIDSWLEEITGIMENIWPNLRKFETVIPTGGGVLVLGEALYKVLIAKGASLNWPNGKEDAILANAIGLWKAGHYALAH